MERLEATSCPPVTMYSSDFGPVVISGPPRPVDGTSKALGPRRIVLDALLVEAAVAAGAELREAFTVEQILVDDGRVTGIRGHAKGGATVTEQARVEVGADGRHSLVAKTVLAERYNEVPALTSGYYAYWSGLPTDAWDIHIRAENHRGWGVIPTHDDLACVVVGWHREFEANRNDLEGSYMKSFELAPEFAERLRGAKRETRLVGTGDLPNFFRKPYGPGWALVGDAGYHKDPITAFGITDAFRDAEAVAAAIDDAFSGRREYDEALAGYQRARDEEAQPIYAFTCDFARIEPPPPEMQQLLGAVAGNQAAMDRFVSVMAGTLPAPEFFGPENIGSIMAQAKVTAGSERPCTIGWLWRDRQTRRQFDRLVPASAPCRRSPLRRPRPGSPWQHPKRPIRPANRMIWMSWTLLDVSTPSVQVSGPCAL
jgi:2-polyprenyl-6-methoxyphenol hydroxylase-like FAD-dependent oxidoreductase